MCPETGRVLEVPVIEVKKNEILPEARFGLSKPIHPIRSYVCFMCLNISEYKTIFDVT